jgi:hypothetical protein
MPDAHFDSENSSQSAASKSSEPRGAGVMLMALCSAFTNVSLKTRKIYLTSLKRGWLKAKMFYFYLPLDGGTIP